MPRPVLPILDRRLITASALALIDEEGLGAFSTVRLARRLGVRAPSLYHHVQSRAEILAGVAELVVRETRLPPYQPGDDWVAWLVDGCTSLRRAILRHPNAAPVLLEHLPRDLLTSYYNIGAGILTIAGVPLALQCLVLDSLETYTISSGLITATAGLTDPPFATEREDVNPHLARAAAADSSVDAEDRFRLGVRAVAVGAVRSSVVLRGADR
ncbi:hypothetical protein GCM10009547_35380 [Sporichthya brevicatena]|uniref:HTH tetR-type domain-containing protein n=1 Tax=Sporichthya brevicatena TaxID=171442 RepID=A0ABN1H4A8_9ACTN